MAAAAVGATVAGAALGARFLPVTNHPVLILAALCPYLCVGAVVAAVLLLAGRRWWAAAAALALTAGAVAVQVPQFRADTVAAGTVPMRVLTANLKEGNADPAALVSIADAQADVLVVQELTPELAVRLNAAGLESRFPFQVLDARPVASGVGIWSRFRVREYSRIGGFELGVVSATLRAPQAGVDAVVLAVHIVGPWPQPIDGWREEMAALPATLRQIAAGAGPAAVIAAGDFNATIDMAPFRALLDDGFDSATRQSGAGLVPTFPADRPTPPLIGIDHILVSNGSASGARSVRIPGSDHLGLVATVHLPA